MKRISIFITLITGAFIIAACNGNSSDKTVNADNSAELSGTDSVETRTDSTSVPQKLTITALVSENPDLSYLANALMQAERTTMLNSNGPYTVFAPIDSAFETLPQERSADLMKPENKDKLADVLAYHIVAGAVKTSELESGQTITTVQGKKLTIEKEKGRLMINGAEVIIADIIASNGVIHQIDRVLMPSGN